MRTYAIIFTGTRPHVEVDSQVAKNKATAVRQYCERTNKNNSYAFRALTANELQKFYQR